VGLGPETVAIRINNRRLMEQKLEQMGIGREKWPEVLRLIDRRDLLLCGVEQHRTRWPWRRS